MIVVATFGKGSAPIQRGVVAITDGKLAPNSLPAGVYNLVGYNWESAPYESWILHVDASGVTSPGYLLTDVYDRMDITASGGVI